MVFQFHSCILFWDTRPSKGQQAKEEDKGPKTPMGISNTFKYLDLTWKPMLKVSFYDKINKKK